MIKTYYIGIAFFMLFFAAASYGGMFFVPATSPSPEANDFYNYLYYMLDGSKQFFLIAMAACILTALPHHKETPIFILKYLLIYSAGYTLTRMMWSYHYRQSAGFWEITTYLTGFASTTFIALRKWKNGYR